MGNTGIPPIEPQPADATTVAADAATLAKDAADVAGLAVEPDDVKAAATVLAKATVAADVELAKAKIAADAEVAKAKIVAEADRDAEIARAKITADAELAKQKIAASERTWGRIQAFALALLVAIPSIITAMRVADYHKEVNSKMDKLIETTASASHAEGVLEGKAAKDKAAKVLDGKLQGIARTGLETQASVNALLETAKR